MSPRANLAAPTAFSPWRDKVAAAAHATFPELFNRSANSDPVHIAMVLNRDGTVYKVAKEDPKAGEADAGLQLSQTLGIDLDELESPATIIVLNKTPDHPNAVIVAFGMRKNK